MSQDQQRRVVTRERARREDSLLTERRSASDTITITVRGRLDGASQLTLLLTLARAIAAGKDAVFVDLEALDEIDLDDAGIFLRARGLLRSQGRHLVIRSPRTSAEVLVACALLDPYARVERIDEARMSNAVLSVG